MQTFTEAMLCIERQLDLYEAEKEEEFNEDYENQERRELYEDD